MDQLTKERKHEIGYLLFKHKVQEERFPIRSHDEMRRQLGVLSKEVGIPAEELEQFILELLPDLIGNMFGWSSCSITGTKAPEKGN